MRPLCAKIVSPASSFGTSPYSTLKHFERIQINKFDTQLSALERNTRLSLVHTPNMWTSSLSLPGMMEGSLALGNALFYNLVVPVLCASVLCFGCLLGTLAVSYCFFLNLKEKANVTEPAE